MLMRWAPLTRLWQRISASSMPRVSLFLLLVAFAANTLVHTSLPVKRFLILCILFVQVWVGGRWRRFHAVDFLRLFPMGIGFWLLLDGTHSIQHLAAALLLTVSAYGLSRDDHNGKREWRAILHAASFYGIGVILCRSLPYATMACLAAAEWISRLAGDIRLGPYASGIEITALLSFVHVAMWTRMKAKSSLWSTVLLSCQWIMLLLFLFLRHAVLERTGNAQVILARGGTEILLFAAGLIPIWIHTRMLAAHSLFAPPQPLRGRVVALIIAATCGGIRAYPIPQPIRTGLRIMIADEGVLDWKVPNFERFGGKSGGMFGLLPEALAAYEHTVTLRPLSEGISDDTDVLVIINPNHTLAPAVEDAVWAYVERGGAVLAMGDHTCRETIREPLNALFDRVNISLNFDSAIPLRSEWQSQEFTSVDFATMDQFLTVDTQIRIGASLEVRPPAWPLIVGRDGFSDKGNPENPNGSLGDMVYTVDERAGDIILAAGAQYGDGKVMVFGDTTSFQNGALPFSLPFVAQCLTWFTTPPSQFRSVLITIAGILLMGVAAIGLLRWRSLVVAPALVGCIVYAGMSMAPVPGFEATPRFSTEPMAVVDLAHLPRCSSGAWHPDGIGGLLYNLIRNGYSASVSEYFSPQDLRPGDVWICVAQARPFRRTEIEQLVQFVESGGHVIVTTGWDERDPVVPFLEHFDLDVRPLPLGKLQPEANSEGIQFQNAWALKEGSDEDSEVLCRAWEYPVAVRYRHGQGSVVLIGDSGFLLNNNLEGRQHYSVPNIQFLKRVLSTMKGGAE